MTSNITENADSWKDNVVTPSKFDVVQELEFDSEYKTYHYVIVTHGIRSYAGAMTGTHAYKASFSDVIIKFEPVSYPWRGILHLFFGYKHKGACDFVVGRINRIINSNPEAQYSIMAHSYGTKVLCDIMDQVSIKFHSIFLFGSICLLDSVGKFDDKSKVIVNDVGTRDVLPILAAAMSRKKFGPTGSSGFFNSPIVDRFFCYRHSGALTEEHRQEWILPTLLTNTLRIKRIDEEKELRTVAAENMKTTRRLWVFKWIILFLLFCFLTVNIF